MTNSYSLNKLTPASTLHADLNGYFLTPESVEPLQMFLNKTTGTERCLVPIVDWGCWSVNSQGDAQRRMAQLFKQMDRALNPHRLLSTEPVASATRVLDPRIRDLVKGFLPQLPETERYSVSEIDAAAERFAKFVEDSGLTLYATTSPCHTDKPQSLTCNWSNFPASVDTFVSLKSGKDIHPKLVGTYLTQRAAAGLHTLINRGETPAAQEALAELVLQYDAAFNPYHVLGLRVIIDGSVAALEDTINRNPPPTYNRISEGYTHYLKDIFKLKWAGQPFVQSAYQMLCTSESGPADITGDATFKISCGYFTTAADGD